MSTALEWIKANQDILSIAALNSKMQLPERTLQTYLETGHLQNKDRWEPVIENFMGSLIHSHKALLRKSFFVYLEDWRFNVELIQSCKLQEFQMHRSEVDKVNHFLEKAMGDVKRMYDLIKKEDKVLAAELLSKVRECLPHMTWHISPVVTTKKQRKKKKSTIGKFQN